PEGGGWLAAAGEGGVGGAVGPVAGEREVLPRAAPDRDDLAVGRERHRGRHVDAKLAPEVGRLLAVAGEAGVEQAVGVVASDGEVVSTGAGLPDRDDLAISLEHHPTRKVPAPELGRLHAVAGER